VDAAAGEVLELYAELDAELAGPAAPAAACRACGRCCDFSKHEEALYASRLERAVLALAAPAPEGVGPEVCPYLHNGKCAARRFRPLGCRTYFCAQSAGARGRELYESYRARLAEISRRAGIEWDYRKVLPRPPPGPGPDFP